MRTLLLISGLLALAAIISPQMTYAQGTARRAHPEKVLAARRINPEPPKIDGVLDDAIWAHTPSTNDFTQLLPLENVAPTESTTVQIAYDDEAIYVGVMLYDHEPKRIQARLARRDQGSETDRINIYFDPYLDHRTGYQFTITAGGSLTDALLYNDTSTDDTWDAIWEGHAKLNDRGWGAEFKIPLRIMRFNTNQDEQTWGFQMTRYISRKQEWAQWVLQRRDGSGWVSRFGHITGIKGIKSSTPFEVLPYTVGRSTIEPKSATDPDGRDAFANAGLDLRYGLTSNVSLSATVNPDFGQVDADPAVLNLSVFETFFQERRPFFVEGGQIYSTPIQLFYSRRIGRQPGYFSTPSGSQTLDRPDFTTIIGATKITGKTQKKTTFGLVNAVTSSENAKIFLGGTTKQFRVEPLTNYFVGRLQQDFRNGNAQLGLIGTAVNRQGANAAYTGGLDWNLKGQSNMYRVSGQFAGSSTGRVTRQQGYASQLRLAKQDGWFRASGQVNALSRGFNANDLGFSQRANRITTSYSVDLIRVRPFGPFTQNSLSLDQNNSWNYAGLNLQNNFNYETFLQFRNFWGIDLGGSRSFKSFDDLDTRGGPPILRPAGLSYFAWVGSNQAKKLSGSVFFNWGSNDAGSTNRSIGPGLTYRPSSRLQLQSFPNYSWNFTDAQYVTQTNVSGQRHYIYGQLRSKVLDLTTRVDLLFTRDISLQLYVQPFMAVGAYSGFKELAAPSSYSFTPYTGLGFNPNFNSRSLRSNMVFRWEYRPGSTIFLVWSQSRSAFSNDPTFRPWNNVRSSFTDDGPNIFQVKVNYFFNI